MPDQLVDLISHFCVPYWGIISFSIWKGIYCIANSPKHIVEKLILRICFQSKVICNYLRLPLTLLHYYFSCGVLCDVWFGYYGWSPSSLGTQILQSKTPIKNNLSHVELDGFSGELARKISSLYDQDVPSAIWCKANGHSTFPYLAFVNSI